MSETKIRLACLKVASAELVHIHDLAPEKIIARARAYEVYVMGDAAVKSKRIAIHTVERTTSKSKFFCGFCGKDQEVVEVLVAGPTWLICNECVEVCSYIIAQRKTERAPDEAAQ